MKDTEEKKIQQGAEEKTKKNSEEKTDRRKTAEKKTKKKEVEKKVILEAFDLYKSYGYGEDEVKALDGVSLKVYDGELLVISGDPDSGKSTLLNMLGGMDIPDSGEILAEGEDICDFDDSALSAYRKDKIGFIFQSCNLINELTARENVALAAAGDAGIIRKVFADVGLEDKMDKYPAQLSDDEKQRVSIARALAKDPQILLCDEAIDALDPVSGRKVLVRFEKLVREEGRTIILTTGTKGIGKLADRVIRMADGQISDEKINKKISKAADIKW